MALVHALVLALVLPGGAAQADVGGFRESATAIALQQGPRLIRLAREAFDAAVAGRELTDLADEAAAAPFGLFVTAVRKGRVRGCFGFLSPQGRSLDAMIAEAAYGAARLDARHPPIRNAEIRELELIVSLVGPTEAVESEREVDPRRMGLMVRAGMRSAVLLPGEARTARWQVAESRRKAGIAPHEPVQLFRFQTVTLYERDLVPQAPPKEVGDVAE